MTSINELSNNKPTNLVNKNELETEQAKKDEAKKAIEEEGSVFLEKFKNGGSAKQISKFQPPKNHLFSANEPGRLGKIDVYDKDGNFLYREETWGRNHRYKYTNEKGQEVTVVDYDGDGKIDSIKIKNPNDKLPIIKGRSSKDNGIFDKFTNRQ